MSDFSIVERLTPVYLCTVNALAILFCMYDKLAASRGYRRVPERTLFGWALLGGGLGLYGCMLLVRHKTKHMWFVMGVPALVVLQLMLVYSIYHLAQVRGLL